MAITGHYIMVNGVKTYYETNNGPAEQYTMVCIHTAGRETRQYHGMMEILASKYRLIALDMPGHGKSWPLEGNKAFSNRNDYSCFIWSFIQTLGIKDPILVGCSLGGNIVYHMAQEYPVRAIISMQGVAYTPGASDVALAVMNHPHVSLQHSHLGYSDSLIGQNPDPGARDFVLWGVCQEVAIAKKGALSIYNGFDIQDSMEKITCPVLAIRGQDDWLVDEESVQDTLSRLTNTKKVIFKPLQGIGHFPAVENPKAVCDAIEEFLPII
jgi:pimeloyl-ACP methyl ester carboxylesterase